VSLAPPNLAGIWGDVAAIAAAAGLPERGAVVIAQLERRLAHVR